MTDLQEALKDEAFKAQLDEYMGKAIEEATGGLKAKNTELLGKVKSLSSEKTAAEEAAEQAAREAAEKSGDVEAVKKSLTSQYQKQIDDLTGKLGTKDQLLHKHVVEAQLSDALSKANVAPQYRDAFAALIKTQNKIEIAENDGALSAVVNGKGLADHISEIAASDVGKHFIAAPANGGGGANGSNGSGKAAGAKTMTRKEFDSLDQHGRMEASRAGTKVIDE